MFVISLLVIFLQIGCSNNEKTGGAMRDDLTVITFNLWHGLNPVGLAKFEEYETPEQREERLSNFIRQARELDPDIIFLQEVNPAPVVTDKIAGELGFDGVFQISNAGIKIGSVGLPANFRSGLSILAKKDLNLEKLGGAKLSGGFGAGSRCFSFQLGEFRYALAAQVMINGQKIILVNLHLHHGLEVTPEITAAAKEIIATNSSTKESWENAINAAKISVARRVSELAAAEDFAKGFGFDSKTAVIFAGDFNSTPGAPDLSDFINRLKLKSTTTDDDPEKLFYTWDPKLNKHTHLAADFLPANSFEEFIRDHLRELVKMQRRRLDYIFYGNMDSRFEVTQSDIFGNKPSNDKMASDHFGVFAKFKAKP